MARLNDHLNRRGLVLLELGRELLLIQQRELFRISKDADVFAWAERVHHIARSQTHKYLALARELCDDDVHGLPVGTRCPRRSPSSCRPHGTTTVAGRAISRRRIAAML